MLSLALTAVLAAWTCDQEDARIRAHLEDAYAQLEHATPAGLTDEQQEGRLAALERLRAYIEAGRFPRNQSERRATPVFVDEDDTHCAMGQLISELGGDEVVQHIKGTRNLETVPVLADEPGLAEWLVAHGMTAEEAALVQPTYFVCEASVPCLGTASTSIYDSLLSNDGGPYWEETPTRVLRSGSNFVCLGDPSRRTFSYDERSWPEGTIHGMPYRLANDGVGWVALSDAQCAERPRLSDDDRLLSDQECVINLARRDLRWFAIMCFDTGFEQGVRCNSDGRYRASVLPARGTMRAELDRWLNVRFRLSVVDAGIDPVAYDAMEARLWELSDDGGTPLDSGVLPVLKWDGGIVAPDCACIAARDVTAFDAGCGARPAPDAGAPARDAGTDPTPMPTGCGCTSVEAFAGALALLFFRRRR